jgi:hypothetical protein
MMAAPAMTPKMSKMLSNANRRLSAASIVFLPQCNVFKKLATP